MTQERNKITGETKKFYWDSENLMIKFEHQASDISPVDISAIYKYDIFGRRIQKNVNGNVINFFWENDTMTYELNESHQPIRKYLVGLGIDSYEGHLEYSEVTDWPHLFDPNYNQPWYSYMKDQVGTIYKLYSLKTRSIVDNRTYDSFGNLVSQTGTTMTPLGFQGKYYDQESGLKYFYHRYYNPILGRFISEDPIGFDSGNNYYSFIDDNSINYIDHFGLLKSYGDFNMIEKRDIQFFPKHKIFGFLGDSFRDLGFTKPKIDLNVCCEPIGNGKYQLDCALSYVVNAYYYFTSTTWRDHKQIHLRSWKRGYQSLVDFLLLNEKTVFNSKGECEKMKKSIYRSFNHWAQWRNKISNEQAGH